MTAQEPMVVSHPRRNNQSRLFCTSTPGCWSRHSNKHGAVASWATTQLCHTSPSGLGPAAIDVGLAVAAADLLNVTGAAGARHREAAAGAAAARAVAKLEVHEALGVVFTRKARARRR
jgi:hypothetical protein